MKKFILLSLFVPFLAQAAPWDDLRAQCLSNPLQRTDLVQIFTTAQTRLELSKSQTLIFRQKCQVQTGCEEWKEVAGQLLYRSSYNSGKAHSTGPASLNFVRAELNKIQVNYSLIWKLSYEGSATFKGEVTSDGTALIRNFAEDVNFTSVHEPYNDFDVELGFNGPRSSASTWYPAGDFKMALYDNGCYWIEAGEPKALVNADGTYRNYKVVITNAK